MMPSKPETGLCIHEPAPKLQTTFAPSESSITGVDSVTGPRCSVTGSPFW